MRLGKSKINVIKQQKFLQKSVQTANIVLRNSKHYKHNLAQGKKQPEATF